VVATWPGVQGVNLDHGRMQIATSDADAVVRRLICADSGMSGLEIRSAGLAEAFTELTQEVAS
jgi:ABC-2 type transport system ATP-binding protein